MAIFVPYYLPRERRPDTPVLHEMQFALFSPPIQLFHASAPAPEDSTSVHLQLKFSFFILAH